VTLAERIPGNRVKTVKQTIRLIMAGFIEKVLLVLTASSNKQPLLFLALIPEVGSFLGGRLSHGKKSLTQKLGTTQEPVGKNRNVKRGAHPIVITRWSHHIPRMCNTKADGRLPHHWDENSQSEFNVTIAYDGLDAAQKAIQLSEFLQEQFRRDLQIQRTVVPFESICNGQIPQGPRNADMIVVASHRCTALPLSLNQWLEGELAASCERPVALVGLVNMGSIRQPTPVYRELEELARATGATLFQRQIQLSDTTAINDLEEPFNESRWGLNE
jgi:hypothetical protein